MNELNQISEWVKDSNWTEFKNLGIDIRHYPDMVLLDYNQIEAVKNHPIVNECRGLLVSHDGRIMRKGFTRFFNLGENGNDTFDFENSVVMDKADGSLCFVYHNFIDNRWELGTRGTAHAEGSNEWHGTFRNFFLACINRTEEEFQVDCEANLSKGVTYLMEGCGPDNRIVTPYSENHMEYLTSFITSTGEELFDDVLIKSILSDLWNVKHPKQYKFSNQKDCIDMVAAMSGLAEGVVVYNTKTGDRIKIKNATYLAAHRLRGNGLTLNAICELVAMGEQAEYLAVFPEDAHKFVDAIDMLGYIKDDLNYYYNEYKHIESQKDFAIAVKDIALSGVMFKARKSGNDVIHEFNQFPTNKKAEWLKDRLIQLSAMDRA